ncbi:MAG: flagellar biosynthetic protein FliO [Firmicutes bacterium]|nr:flagellar biosynthetic protein FliO [Bacillota bacterium]
MYGYYIFFLTQINIFFGSILDKDSNMSFFMGLMKIMYILIVFLIILCASYYLSRFIARKNFGKNKIMKLVETLSLGYDRNVYIIRIGENYFLISSTQKNINFLYKLSEEDIKNAILEQKKGSDFKFDNILSDVNDEASYDVEGKNQESITNSIFKVIKKIRGRND